MKIYSKEHFDNMQMMCRYFESKSKDNDLYLPEFTASKSINNVIQYEENSVEGIQKILKTLAEIENSQHYNDAHWLDYKMHVMAVLRENGYTENDVQLIDIENTQPFIKQYNFQNNTLKLKVKKSPFLVRAVMFALAFSLFIFPVLGAVFNIATGGGLNIMFFIVIGLFSLLGFHTLRMSLWNTYGEETIVFSADKIIYEADYGWFKDGKKETVISSKPNFYFVPAGYEDDKEGVLIITSDNITIQSVVKIKIIQLEELISILETSIK